MYLKRVRTPLFMQMETVDCGAAALGVILAYHGCYIPLEQLRATCLTSRDGVSVPHLVKAAEHFGMHATVCREGLSQKMKPPFILFWNRKHYVVLEGIKANHFFINDPKRGPVTLDEDTFNRCFSGVSIHLNVNEQFKKITKPKPWINRIWPLFKEQWMSFSLMCICMMLTTFMPLMPPIFTKYFIDQYLVKHTPPISKSFFYIMLSLAGIQMIVLYTQRRIFRKLETRLSIWLNSTLVHHLMQLPLKFFTYRRAGDVLYRLQATERLSHAPISTAYLTINTYVVGLMSIGLMFMYSPLLCLVASMTLSIYFMCLKYSQMRWGYLANTTKTSMASLVALTTHYVAMITQIKAHCSESAFFSKWQQQLDDYLRAHRQFSLVNHIEQIISLFFFSMGYLSILVLGVYSIGKNWMTVGEMMACHVLFWSLHDALSQYFKLNQQHHQIEADMQYITDISDYPIASKVSVPHSLLHVSQRNGQQPFKGKIQVIDLTFGYSREFKPLFHQFNMTIEAGAHIAIVGPSGSGKSTLIHLIAGLYQPWAGSILIDGIPLSNFSDADRARLIGVVNQAHFFYQGSIRDNLKLWDESYSDAEITHALRMACIDELVKQSPKGLDFLLLEGATNLSGGQRQRLEIARTLLGKPNILILDEASNSLDPIIERQIKNNLQRYQATQISVAHRLDTIQNADQIFILKHGELVDYGAKHQLLTKKSAPFINLFSTSE